MATAKYAAGAAGLNPADYADMKAVAASSTAMAAVAASSTAMTAIIANSTALNAVVTSSTAMTAVAASSTAMTAVADFLYRYGGDCCRAGSDGCTVAQ